MKRLFTGKFGRIPVAVLLTVLLTVIIAGGVVAATGGYVLWEGTIGIEVNEPISIHYGPSFAGCTNPLAVSDPLGATAGLWAGQCVYTWFEITSASDADLLIGVDSIASDATVVAVTLNYYDADENPIGELLVCSGAPVYVERIICVDGAADPTLYYTVSTTFTRESPPPPPTP